MAKNGSGNGKAGSQPPLQARLEGGGTPRMTDWVMKSETGLLKDVLLGPAESFRWMGEENAAYSSLVRDTLRRGYKFDKQVAARQHREMVDAYEDAGVTCHFLPVDMHNPYQVYARDSELHDRPMAPSSASSPTRGGAANMPARCASISPTAFRSTTWSAPAISRAAISTSSGMARC